MGDIDLLMIGKTGNGKSALGNTILRRKAFRSMSKTSSVTTKVHYEVSEFKGRVIKVVDGPGVGDTRMDNEKATTLVMDSMSYAISANPRGYHAFLLVVKFGGRFTVEDQNTIAFLKKIFGENFVRDFCILVMTCGDNFETESEETGQTFQEWCKEQEGVFQDLLLECNKRVILFDNRMKDENKKFKQINDLIKMVDHLTYLGHRYKDENFEKAKTTRERMMVEAKIPMIRDDTMRETSLIFQKLQTIQTSDEPENCKADLEKLLTRTELLYDSIKTQDKGTGALHELAETVNSLKKSIQDEIRIAIRIAKEKEERMRAEAEWQRAQEEQTRRLIEEYENKMKKERLEEQKRRALEKEQLQKLREIEERSRKEREEREMELLRKFEIERNKNKRITEELERQYQEAKEKNEEGILNKVVGFVTWPFRKLFG